MVLHEGWTGNDRFEIGPMGSIRTACPQPVLDREFSFKQGLESASRFTRERTKLRPTGDSGDTAMELVQTDSD